MEDATFELLAKEQAKSTAALSLIAPPIYNIDDMDGPACMINLEYTGCMCIRSSKFIDPARIGFIYIDGEQTEPPVMLPPVAMFGQLVGVRVRKYLREYNRDYKIEYKGAYDIDGQPLEDFVFTLHTVKRMQPGEEFPEHDKLVLNAARESIVLLKNNGALPVKKGSTLNGFGSGFVIFRGGCLGAGKINPRYAIRVKEGAKYTSLKINEELYDFYSSEENILPSENMISRAKEKCDIAIVFISRTSSEAHEMKQGKGGYYLTDGEREILKNVRRIFGKVVAVLNTAYPIECGWINEMNIDAVLWTGLCGMAGGRALCEILEGKVNPSGKLPNTWALDYDDYPSSSNFFTGKRIKDLYDDIKYAYSAVVYEEDIYVGYRYFDTYQKPYAYIFGHGLSYTTFSVNLENAIRKKGATQLELKVTNTGEASGKEVVAVYATINGKSRNPKHILVAFEKTRLLKPNASQTLKIVVKDEMYAVYDEEEACYNIEEGEVTLSLGGTPDNAKSITTVAMKKRIVRKTNSMFAPPCNVDILGKKEGGDFVRSGIFTAEQTGGKLPYKKRNEYPDENRPPLEYKGELISFSRLQKDHSLLDSFVGQMSVYELARLSVGGATGWGNDSSGFAGMLSTNGALEKYGIPSYIFADGNNGCNMRKTNVGFPTSGSMCASWNKSLMKAEGKAIAREARTMHLNCILAPAMNIQRNPLCGRHAEYFSEDPYLAGTMAGYQIAGLEENGVSASMKHIYANNCEILRNMTNSIMTERAARDVYLKAFEYAIKIYKPSSVMTGYNAANGIYSADNYALLNDYLRGELGFEGYVMTDWNGYGDEGIPVLIKAGVNWIAPGSADDTLVNPIVEAVQAGELKLRTLQESVKRLLRIVAKSAY